MDSVADNFRSFSQQMIKACMTLFFAVMGFERLISAPAVASYINNAAGVRSEIYTQRYYHQPADSQSVTVSYILSNVEILIRLYS